MDKYWVCIIKVKTNKIPSGFDGIPRRAAIEAIEKKGIPVEDCWSGWECAKERFDKLMELWHK